jgi:putative Mg2+ transporter-C (MgtC) family protein
VCEPTGQGWLQVFELAPAFVLSAAIGLEREIRPKGAGLRTHTLVGFGSALMAELDGVVAVSSDDGNTESP